MTALMMMLAGLSLMAETLAEKTEEGYVCSAYEATTEAGKATTLVCESEELGEVYHVTVYHKTGEVAVYEASVL